MSYYSCLSPRGNYKVYGIKYEDEDEYNVTLQGIKNVSSQERPCTCNNFVRRSQF